MRALKLTILVLTILSNSAFASKLSPVRSDPDMLRFNWVSDGFKRNSSTVKTTGEDFKYDLSKVCDQYKQLASQVMYAYLDGHIVRPRFEKLDVTEKRCLDLGKAWAEQCPNTPAIDVCTYHHYGNEGYSIIIAEGYRISK